jgi:hypothetical protein
MKTKINSLLLIFALALPFGAVAQPVADTIDPAADTVLVNGQMYTLENGNEVSVEMSREYNGVWDAPTVAIIYIIDSASGVQITCGRDIDSTIYAFPESTTPYLITFTRGKATIRLKGTAGDDIVIMY